MNDEELNKLNFIINEQQKEIDNLKEKIKNNRLKNLNEGFQEKEDKDRNEFIENNLKKRFLNKNFDNEYFKPILLKNPIGKNDLDLFNKWNNFKNDLENYINKDKDNKKKKIKKKKKSKK